MDSEATSLDPDPQPLSAEPRAAPLVTCAACHRAWHSKTMAEGLREIGSCPRCGGTLTWTDRAGASLAEDVDANAGLEPYLVLGVPRR